MLKFLVFDNGSPAEHHEIRNAYLLSADNNAMQGQISFRDSQVICEKRETSAAALALQHDAGDCGVLTIQTCLLPDRDQPYVLNIELARHRLMTLYNKLEDWSMFEIGRDHPVTQCVDTARTLFIESVCCQEEEPARAAKLAGESLVASIDGCEKLALAHAELLMSRRKATGLMPQSPIGSGLTLTQSNDRVRAGLMSSVDYLCLPLHWRDLAPEEGEYQWKLMDRWARWITRTRTYVMAGPLICFDPRSVPDWLFIWEHDYDTVRDLVYEHTERVVTRYRNAITAWNVVSGLHINSHFTFTFEQLMDLTRMSLMQVKKIQPAARALVEIRQPFGEYYGNNQRSIPPLMYADLLVQSGISFDGIVIKLLMGQAAPGQYARDLMQISNLLDQYVGFGKPVILAIAAPSTPITAEMLQKTPAGESPDSNCGYWRRPWSPQVQGRWLEAVIQIAMSKPFIESVVWQEMIDHEGLELPMSGLVGENLKPKSALARLVRARQGLAGPVAEGAHAAVAAPGGEAGIEPDHPAT